MSNTSKNTFNKESNTLDNKHRQMVKYLTTSKDTLNHILLDIDNSDMPKYMSESILYVQLSDAETFGVSVLEAMSCGIPVVTSRSGAFPEVIGNQGIFVNHNDYLEVADVLLDLLLNKQDYIKKLGIYLSVRVKNLFSYEERRRKLSYYFTKYLNN